MGNYEIEAVPDSQTSSLRPEQRTQANEIAKGTGTENPVHGCTSLPPGFSPQSASLALKHHSAHGQAGVSRYMLQLQRHYGNRYAQRVVDQTRKESENNQVDSEVKSATHESASDGGTYAERLWPHSQVQVDVTRQHTGVIHRQSGPAATEIPSQKTEVTNTPVPHAPPPGPTFTPIGDVDALERDIHDVLSDWALKARDGVLFFTARLLSERIDELESGSMESFITGLAGNTLWAATAFLPGAPAMAIFAVSMVGIAIASASSVPSKKSDQTIERIDKLMIGQINAVTDRINSGDEAKRLFAKSPNLSRFEAIAKYARENFQPGYFNLREGDVPKGGVATGTIDPFWINLIWIKKGSSAFLARTFGREFMNFVDEDLKKSAIDEAFKDKGMDEVAQLPMVPADEIKDLPDVIPATTARK
jgi:hypothetical protein